MLPLTDGLAERDSKRRRGNDENPSSTASNPLTATTLQGSQQVSNIANVTPVVGMTLEIRDSDYIWSSARLVNVEEDDNGDTHVTVRCDGWGVEWDERLAWPNERLARLYTYTKRVKCLVNLLPKSRSIPKHVSKQQKKRKVQYSNVWPCTVQFRMPHPFQEGCSDEEQCKRAEELLRLEVNVHVVPYGVSFLPTFIVQSLNDDGGRWLNAYRLRLWRDDPSELGGCPKNFDAAYEEAKNDTTVQGFLPSKAVSVGSLVTDMYRVRAAQGPTADGAMRASAPHKGDAKQKPQQKPPKVVQVKKTTVSEKKDNAPKDDQYPKYQLPPALQPSIGTTEPVYPGVSRCKKTKQWVASVSMGGNDLFLGTFPTQTQAWNATRMSTKQMKGTTTPTELEAARRLDLEAIPLETIVDSTENQWNPATHTFSQHQWILQKVSHAAYLSELECGRTHSETRDSIVAEERTEKTASQRPAKKGRKQSRPGRVNIARGNSK